MSDRKEKFERALVDGQTNELRRIFEQMQTEINKLNRSIPNAKTELASYRTKYEQIVIERDKAESAAASLRRELDAANRRIAELSSR